MKLVFTVRTPWTLNRPSSKQVDSIHCQIYIRRMCFVSDLIFQYITTVNLREMELSFFISIQSFKRTHVHVLYILNLGHTFRNWCMILRANFCCVSLNRIKQTSLKFRWFFFLWHRKALLKILFRRTSLCLRLSFDLYFPGSLLPITDRLTWYYVWQHRQCTCNVILRRVRETFVAVENKYYILHIVYFILYSTTVIWGLSSATTFFDIIS
jgi:hypothetical protein